MSDDVIKVYDGFIRMLPGCYDSEDMVHLCDEPYNPLLEEIQDDVLQYGNLISVRYFIADQALSPDEVLEQIVKISLGLADVEYQPHYSDITGYLWTDTDLNIGGHDLIDELESFEGKYCWLEITYHTGQDNDATD